MLLLLLLLDVVVTCVASLRRRLHIHRRLASTRRRTTPAPLPPCPLTVRLRREQGPEAHCVVVLLLHRGGLGEESVGRGVVQEVWLVGRVVSVRCELLFHA